MPVQLRNDQMVGLLESEFQKRYEPNFSWGNILSMYQMLFGLRGFWPLSATGSSGGAFTMQGASSGINFANNGNSVYRPGGLCPHVDLNGSTQWLSVADAAQLDILGNEAWIDSSYRGLTLGAWVRTESAISGSSRGIIGKYNQTGNQRSYLINVNTSQQVQMIISTDGINNDITTPSTDTLSTNTWYFIVGVYDPSTSVDIWVNLSKTTVTAAVPAAPLFNSTASFILGAINEGAAQWWDGDLALPFVCSADLPDYVIKSLFHHSCALFGVRP